MPDVRIEEISKQTEGDLDALALEQGHQLFCPTHVLIKDGSVVGSMSIGGMPLVHLFYGVGKMGGRDVLKANRLGRDLIASYGWEDFATFLPPSSPVFPYAERMGLVDLGWSRLHIGNVK